MIPAHTRAKGGSGRLGWDKQTVESLIQMRNCRSG